MFLAFLKSKKQLKCQTMQLIYFCISSVVSRKMDKNTMIIITTTFLGVISVYTIS